MSVTVKHHGVEDDFFWAPVDSGADAALENFPGDWRVDVYYDAETEGLTFTIKRDETELLPRPDPLSIEQAHQAERMSAANTFPAFVAGYLHEILERNGL